MRVPIIRIKVCWDYIGVPPFWKITICYQYVRSTTNPVLVTVKVRDNKNYIRVRVGGSSSSIGTRTGGFAFTAPWQMFAKGSRKGTARDAVMKLLGNIDNSADQSAPLVSMLWTERVYYIVAIL